MHFTKPTARVRKASVGLALAAAVALLAGCSTAAAPSDGPVELEFFNFTAGADHEAQLQGIVDAFEKENPNITINVQNAPYEDYFTSLKTRIAGNTAPDTFELNYENFVSFAASGALLDLETSAPDAIDKSVYFPKAYDAFNYDGVQLGLPELSLIHI